MAVRLALSNFAHKPLEAFAFSEAITFSGWQRKAAARRAPAFVTLTHKQEQRKLAATAKTELFGVFDAISRFWINEASSR